MAACVVATATGVVALGAGTAPALGAACPNQSLRAQSLVNPATGQPFSEGLPDCRAYEMVSPLDKQGQEASQGQSAGSVSSDGSRATFVSLGAFSGASSFNGSQYANQYLSVRGDGGWATSSLFAPGSLIALQLLSPADYTPDLTRALQCSDDRSTPSIVGKGYRCAVREADGTWRATPDYQVIDARDTASTRTQYLGASRDLSHVVFTTMAHFLPEDTHETGKGFAIYEIAGVGGPNPKLRLVSVDADGASFPGTTAQALPGLGSGNTAAATADQYQAISADGSRIFFSAQPAGGTQTIYARVNGTETVTVSAPECSGCSPTPAPRIYQGASADKRRVFFLTTQQMVDGDTDTTNDLYEYDFDKPLGRRLTQVSGGGLGDATPGDGAAVQGVVRPSEDGSHVYFVAQGVLTTLPNGRGQTATAGANNLYVYTEDAEHPQGDTKFVATVAGGDTSLWDLGNNTRQARTTPDGRYLLFATTAPLITSGPTADADASADIYRYDAATGELLRVSVGNATAPTTLGRQGNTPGYAASITPIAAAVSNNEGFSASVRVNTTGRSMSDDGATIIFATSEALQGDDVNGNGSPATCLAQAGGASPGCDVYEWRDGQVSLISDGHDADGANNSHAGTTGKSVLGMSGDGSAIFFSTRTPLVGQDTDAQGDVYVARVNGGLPYAVSKSCVGDACQGAPSPRPTAPVAGSIGFVGPGNVTLPTPPTPRPQVPVKLRVFKVEAVRGTSTRIAVRVPERGKIRTSGSGLRRSLRTAKRAGGTYHVAVRLSKRARRTLKRGHRVRVRVRVRFTPQKGRAQTVRVRVTFKPAKHQASRRGARRPASGRASHGAGR